MSLRDTIQPRPTLINVMVDLETLGRDYDAVFTNLGACMFDPLTGEIGDTYYQAIEWQSSIDAGRTIDAGTLHWWMSQDEEARKEILMPGLTLDWVLADFAAWLPATDDLRIWGNGPNFDIGKLETAYGIAKIPWPYYAPRCVRTIRDLAEGIVDKNDVPFEGIKHHALHDAIHQASYVSRMTIALRAGH